MSWALNPQHRPCSGVGSCGDLSDRPPVGLDSADTGHQHPGTLGGVARPGKPPNDREGAFRGHVMYPYPQSLPVRSNRKDPSLKLWEGYPVGWNIKGASDSVQLRPALVPALLNFADMNEGHCQCLSASTCGADVAVLATWLPQLIVSCLLPQIRNCVSDEYHKSVLKVYL